MDILQSRGEHVVEFYRALKGVHSGAPFFYGRMLKCLPRFFSRDKEEREIFEEQFFF